MIEFVYKEYIEKEVAEGRLKILHDGVMSNVKGLSLSNGDIFINLSATQWKGHNEEEILENLPKTINHEILHNLLVDSRIDLNAEERVCQTLSDQMWPYGGKILQKRKI